MLTKYEPKREVKNEIFKIVITIGFDETRITYHRRNAEATFYTVKSWNEWILKLFQDLLDQWNTRLVQRSFEIEYYLSKNGYAVIDIIPLEYDFSFEDL